MTGSDYEDRPMPQPEREPQLGQKAIDYYLMREQEEIRERMRLKSVVQEVQHEWDRVHQLPTQKHQHHMLTTTDLVALANAGIAIDMNTVTVIPARDHILTNLSNDDLLQPLVDRLRRVGPTSPVIGWLGGLSGIQVSAIRGRDTVHVVYSRDYNKPAVFEDDPKLYPSDTLLANIMLYNENHVREPEGTLQSDSAFYQSAPAVNAVPWNGMRTRPQKE